MNETTSADMQKQSQMHEPPPQIRGPRPAIMTWVTSPSRIAAAPSWFYGLPVSLHAPVATVMGPRAFTLDEDAWFAGPDLLVLVPNVRTEGSALTSAQYVTVVGTVRPLVRAELERDYDWFNAVPGIDVELENRPVVVAEAVRTSGGVEIAADRDVTRVFLTTAGDIAQVPGRYFGRSVSVRAEVEDAISSRLFTLDEDKLFAGPDVLVINPFPLNAAAEDEVVTVVGTIRPMDVAGFERDYDWFDASLFQTDLRGYERRPVLVAHSIVRSGGEQMVRVVPGFTLAESERAMASRGSDRRPASGSATRKNPGQ